MRARLLDAAANECAFGFAPRQDVAAGQAAASYTFELPPGMVRP